MTNHTPLCARDGCPNAVYTDNALYLQSSIGPLVVYVCAEHFALYLQRPVAPQTEATSKGGQAIHRAFVYAHDEPRRNALIAEVGEWDMLSPRSQKLYARMAEYLTTVAQEQADHRATLAVLAEAGIVPASALDEEREPAP